MQTKRVIYAALAGNLLVALTKAVAAVITGSSAMVSEAVHSFVDSGDQILLLYGIHRSKRPPHPEHPLGHGRELYFWTFIVAILIFALGAGISIYEGILHVQKPEPIDKPIVNYVVLGLSAVFEGWTWLIALREYRRTRRHSNVLEEFRRTKDPPAFLVLFEDTAALTGIAIAAVATVLTTQFGIARADGIASLLIGLILAGIAYVLAQESKSLLIGEQASPELRDSILQIARSAGSATRLEILFTVQLSPDQVIVALGVEFPDAFRAPEIARDFAAIERQVRAKHREVVGVFVRPLRNG